MNEARAREVTLLQAFESAHPPSPSWSDDDRAWATRLALQDDPADAETFIARRAHHAMQRLVPREPMAAKWLAARAWRPQWIAVAALAGLVCGALADSIGSSQRINLLAPPLWGVLAWNLVVYGLLLGRALARVFARMFARKTRPGALVRLMQRAMGAGRGAIDPHSGKGNSSGNGNSSAGVLQTLAGLWWRLGAPLAAVRAATLLHVAAAALALGLVAGMYLRGLVLDYRAAWESTFLSADAARSLLGAVLAPASALSGIAWPDAAAFEALRTAHGIAAAGVSPEAVAAGVAPGTAAGVAPGTSAAPWIHLLALTLLLFVVLPRGVLAAVDAARAHWLARHLALPLNEPYFERLARERHGHAAQVVVLPYASTPTAQAALGLRAVLAAALGKSVRLRIEATTAFGDEDAPAVAVEDASAVVAQDAPAVEAGTIAVALFDLSATPEAESQGRFVQQLVLSGATVIVLVDEAAFAQRFGAGSTRLSQRRDAWRASADALGTTAVFADLDAPDAVATARDLQLAMREAASTS